MDFKNKKWFFLVLLVGYMDLFFRSVVKKFGVDVIISEMVSLYLLVYVFDKIFKMLEKFFLEDYFMA